jgi:hypothetical protein
VADVAKQFNVAPSIQQVLETKMQESSDFLSKINVTPVVESQGAKLGLGMSGPVASRTNTDTADRKTRDVSTLDSKGYPARPMLGITEAFKDRLRDKLVDLLAKG